MTYKHIRIFIDMKRKEKKTFSYHFKEEKEKEREEDVNEPNRIKYANVKGKDSKDFFFPFKKLLGRRHCFPWRRETLTYLCQNDIIKSNPEPKRELKIETEIAGRNSFSFNQWKDLHKGRKKY